MRKRAVKESEAFPELYGLTKRPKYTREIHMLRIGRMMERAERQAQEGYDAGYNYSPWEYLCGMCPACTEFGSIKTNSNERYIPYESLGSIRDLWDSSVHEICSICREFVGLSQKYYGDVFNEMGALSGPCPCHELSPRDAYYKTKEVL